MKIKSLKIKNFKTFDSEGIFLNLTNLTAFIGGNSTGKSNILEAIDLFFNFSKPKMSKRCFHHDDVTKEIVIEITFDELNENEKKIFKIHLDENNETLTITQRIRLKLEEEQDIDDLDEEDYDFEESKHGTKWETTVEWARLSAKLPTKTNIKKWWQEELTINGFHFKKLFDDHNNPPPPETYKSKLEQLWDENFDIIPKERQTGDEKVLGWKNKLKGNLPKFFYVPAVKHVEDDLKVGKTNPFGEMISWLSRNISDDIKEEFDEKTKKNIEEALGKIDKDEDGKSKIAFLNEQLNSNLGVDLGCKLELKFGTPKIREIIFPSPQLYADDGYYSEVKLKGHGIQRLAIISLLRTYNELKKRVDNDDKNMIVAIEEPEIYLHPPIKRATYKLFRSLSEKNEQIIYSSHDSYFVAVEHFDEIRLFKKVKNGKHKTEIYEFSIDSLIKFYKKRYKITVDENSLRHRFGHICDETKTEGFFADKVILVEGVTEKYSLPIYFAHKGFDLDNEKVAIISAGATDNIGYLFVIFNEFHIPCYIIFDGDKPDIDVNKLKGDKQKDAKSKSQRNKELLEFVGKVTDAKGEYFFPPTSVKNKYAVWEKNFETTFHKPLDNYDEIKGSAKNFYGSHSKPLTGRFFADVLTSKFPEKISSHIDELIDNIKKCCWDNSCLCDS